MVSFLSEEKRTEFKKFFCLFVLAIDFNITKILQNPKVYTMPAFKEESRPSKVPTKVWSIMIIKKQCSYFLNFQ